MDENTFNCSDNVADDGNFTEAFRTNLPGLVGDSYNNEDGTPTKIFDNVTNLQGLLKEHVNLNRAFGKKQENVIQKPGQDASDDDKTNYRNTLASELGVAANVSEIEFDKVDMPEGMTVKEDVVNGLKQLCVDKKIPFNYVKEIYNWFQGIEAASFTANKEAEVKAFTEASEKLTGDWLGDKMVENSRNAFGAIVKFNSDNPEMLKTLKEAGIYDDPGNLGLWRTIGIMPSDIRSWSLIADEMGVSVSPGGDFSFGKQDGSMQDQANKFFPNTPKELNKV